ncbi:YY1-associated factor 2 isoform X2 [Chiloscyllium plagiosum]|uniref:YY1-associated factor 2 isoform X2 n=1 Tax=Chiloscyllium plagiosum TaxID=36176 RepID=UPI001CB83D1B|nr:YY1-associated factor 2 isoform X2 [Chiloscyllium plagiosum]
MCVSGRWPGRRMGAGVREAKCCGARYNVAAMADGPKRQPKPSTDEGYWDCSVCTFKNSAEAFKCSMCDVRKGTSTRPCYGRTAKQSGCHSPSQGKPPVSITTSKSHPGRPTRSNPSSIKLQQLWLLELMLRREGLGGTTSNIHRGEGSLTIWKPRPVSQLVAQQVTQQFASPTQPKKEKKDKGEKEKNEKETVSKKNSHKKTRPRLKNVDRSSAQHLEVTVGDLTVIITDFKEKARSAPAATATSSTTADQHSLSSSSSDNTEKGLSQSSSPRGEGSVNGESH